MSLSVDVYDEILKLDRISDMVGLRPAVVIIVVNTTRIWVTFPRAVVGGYLSCGVAPMSQPETCDRTDRQ